MEETVGGKSETVVSKSDRQSTTATWQYTGNAQFPSLLSVLSLSLVWCFFATCSDLWTNTHTQSRPLHVWSSGHLKTSFTACWIRAQSGWCEITGLEWPTGGLWLQGVKGAQKAADLSAIHIISVFIPLQQEQPRVLMVSRNTSLNLSPGCAGNQQWVHLPPNSLSLTLVEAGLLSS